MDMKEFFDTFPLLNESRFADRIGMNRSLLRGYRCKKVTRISEERLKRIEDEIHRLGAELQEVELSK